MKKLIMGLFLLTTMHTSMADTVTITCGQQTLCDSGKCTMLGGLNDQYFKRVAGGAVRTSYFIGADFTPSAFSHCIYRYDKVYGNGKQTWNSGLAVINGVGKGKWIGTTCYSAKATDCPFTLTK